VINGSGEILTTKVAVVAGEAVTAMGNDLSSLWLGVMQGRSGVKKLSRFPVKGCASTLAACIDELEPEEENLLADQLVDRLLVHFSFLPEDCRVLTATTKAGIEELERARLQQRKAKARLISPMAMMDNIVQRYQLNTVPLSINAACASSTIALARGAAMIAQGECEAVFVCAYDAITEFIFCGFSSLKALSPLPSQPFDSKRQGLNLGEGAVGIFLMSEERAIKENKKIMATISGWGINNDAHHVTAPTRDGSGLYIAIEKAMNKAQLTSEDIAAISAHGTGTVHNDLMELKAFYNYFREKKVPQHSVKGAIGHTLGAAGGIEALLSIKMLEEQVVPPTCGFVEAISEVPGHVSAAAQRISGSHILSTNSGFGGVNAALVISKVSS